MLLAFGAPDGASDLDGAIVVGMLALDDDGSLVASFERSDESTIRVRLPRSAVAPELLAWFEARRVAA